MRQLTTGAGAMRNVSNVSETGLDVTQGRETLSPILDDETATFDALKPKSNRAGMVVVETSSGGSPAQMILERALSRVNNPLVP